ILRDKPGAIKETNQVTNESLVGILKDLPGSRSMIGRSIGAAIPRAAGTALSAGRRQVKIASVKQFHKRDCAIGSRRCSQMFPENGTDAVAINGQRQAQVAKSSVAFRICTGYEGIQLYLRQHTCTSQPGSWRIHRQRVLRQ